MCSFCHQERDVVLERIQKVVEVSQEFTSDLAKFWCVTYHIYDKNFNFKHID